MGAYVMRKLSMDELGRKSVEEFKQAEKNKIIVVLDNVRSVYNVGSIFRTSDAFLIEAICVCGYTPTPEHKQMNKTALGATESVDWFHCTTVAEAITQLRENDYKIYAVEQVEGSVSLEQFASTDERIAVIFGNEVEGVQNGLLPLVDGCIEIPQLGMKHSLNISVAAGIVLWKLSEPKFMSRNN